MESSKKRPNRSQINQIIRTIRLRSDPDLRDLPRAKVLIISPGKTGTTTLQQSFARLVPTARFHIDQELFSRIPGYRNRADLTNRLLETILHNRTVLTVTVYREPISRTISAFFNNLSPKTNLEVTNQNLERIGKMLLDRLLMAESYSPLDTINHLKPVLEQPFDRARGYTKYQTPHGPILALRFDKIGSFESIIQRTSQYRRFRMLPSNVSSNKSYANFYRAFKQWFRIPRDLIEAKFWIERDLLNRFYGPEETQRLKAAWLQRSIEPRSPQRPLPDHFDHEQYRHHHPELAALGMHQLRAHYVSYG